MIRRPPRSTLFPYTTLFRSVLTCPGHRSSNPRKFDDELGAVVFLGHHANASAVSLNNLIHDRKPKTGSAGKARLQRLKDFLALACVQADARVMESDPEPKGTRIKTDRQSSARRHGRSEERRVGKECRSRWSPYH